MQRTDFFFDLPEELIAKFPAEQRTHSRLLTLEGQSGNICDKHFYDIVDLINEGDLIVFNNTKVIPARAYGKKSTGANIEILVERITGEHTAIVHLKSSRSPKEGATLIFDNGYEAIMKARHGSLFELEFTSEKSVLTILNEIGHIPLPPYIDRADQLSDNERYQTVYSRIPGAVAAPTAGLHFDDALLDKLKAKGVDFAFVTLHVGAGTFQPVKVDNILEHHMHSEYAEVSQEVVDKILKTRANGKRVIAVGTTSVRSLESAALKSKETCGEVIAPFNSDTSIFIYPGYKFNVVDALITNFHLPESTLIMLVSAFAGYTNTMNAYKHAVKEKYRFFSYGDAMFIQKNLNPESAEQVEILGKGNK